ncbi:hypothetical protein BDV38DRAFT_208562 [Aspergillus pseudotamarii]|uniref:Uncharacterized protein n=1 Tax=Aspergillus pseudotamarii TaxID=132259 RepID=A0A5N6SCS1_ASPPS|nr:uncharacterized protein BDV38DRAFT_208562 [Aspergillus pseudotamarii]KAE8132518.1 hypothetical protein BDV38DRAFT_208562 [Aspergillus pseudotamarii]
MIRTWINGLSSTSDLRGESAQSNPTAHRIRCGLQGPVPIIKMAQFYPMLLPHGNLCGRGVGLGSRPSRFSVWTLLLGVSTYLTVEGARWTCEVIPSKPLSNFSNIHP